MTFDRRQTLSYFIELNADFLTITDRRIYTRGFFGGRGTARRFASAVLKGNSSQSGRLTLVRLSANAPAHLPASAAARPVSRPREVIGSISPASWLTLGCPKRKTSSLDGHSAGG